MNLLVVTNQYPSKEDYYRNAFIHTRNKEYIKMGKKVSVFVLRDEFKALNKYVFDGITVTEGNSFELENLLKKHQGIGDIVLVHFLNVNMMRVINKFLDKLKIIVFIHGYEALGWYRRIYDFNKAFIKYIFTNTFQLYNLRKFIKKSKNYRVKFIFVSKWMLIITERDTLTKIDNYEIIPNAVNTETFNYLKKDEEKRKKILSIRPYSSRKYANDITVKAILDLSQKSFFNELEFAIYGKGKYFKKLTKKLEGFENVKLYNKFLSQSEIAKIHKDYGIFLCPTRQDAQGVSMCEAMSSGLVPISSNNTAIPEFVKNMETGILTNNYKEISRAVEELYENTDRFKKMSFSASRSINEICSHKEVILKELKIMEEIENKN